jgi:endonuclease YncB( thermonuclease family)
MKYKLVEHQTLEGTVTAVHDGDSIKVVFPNETVWVRLYGCDAPEVISNYVTSNQPFGVESGAALRKLVKGKKVVVETLFRDRYNRMICKVSVKQEESGAANIDLTEYVIANGFAWWLSEPKMAPETAERLKSLHDTAKGNKSGLWGISGRKLRPSTWRKDHKRFATAKVFEDLW